MYDFSVVLNGRTFTQADFEGLAYLAGLPDSIEALVDESFGDVNTSWPTTNTSFNPSALASTTFSLIAAPRRGIPQGAFVVVFKAGLNGMCGIVTSTTSSTLTIQGLSPLSNATNSVTAGPWTIARVRGGLTPYHLDVTGTPEGGGYGSESTDQSVLFQGPMSTVIREDSTVFASNSGMLPTLDGGIVCESLNNPSIGRDVNMRLSYPALTPFAYGTCIFDLYYDFSEAEVNSQSFMEFRATSGDYFIRVNQTQIRVKLLDLDRTSYKSPHNPARFIFTAHTSRLQVLDGSSSQYTTSLSNSVLSLQMHPQLKFTDPAKTYGTTYPNPPKAYYRYSYAQQVWR